MKTGSSSIQYWLHRNAEAFLRDGVACSLSIGGRNRSWLAHLADGVARGGDLSPENAAWLATVRAEFAALPAGITTVVLSGEMMGQMLVSAGQVAALKRVLDPYFAHYRVIAYLRRQDRLSVSRYSTALRHGEQGARPLARVVDLEAMLTAWSEVFGRDAMTVRLFDRNELIGGDVVRDFAAAAGMPAITLDDAPVDRNPSLRPEAQMLLSELAARVRQAGHAGPFNDLPGVDIVARVLAQGFAGRGMMPGRADARGFYDRHRAANERIRRAWFPERSSLFDEDFSDYPEEPSADPSAEERLEPALAALTALLLGGAHAIGEGKQSREERRAARRARRMGGGEPTTES